MTQSPLPRARARAALDAINPYVPGMTLEAARAGYGPLDFAKLASNENPYGPSPAALTAVSDALARPELYPDSTCGALRAALAARFDVEPRRVAVGPGSDALIDYFFRAYLAPGDALLRSAPTFPSYDIFARSAGADIWNTARGPLFTPDTDALIASLARGPRVLALCTPNNPTGDAISRADLGRILAATPHATAVLLDEAYFEFQDEASARDLLEQWGGVFLLIRTFSKAYGLAGLRVGYGIASEAAVVTAMDKLRPAFNVTAMAQAAALAALADQGHMTRSIGAIVAERSRVQAALDAAGITHIPSAANFIFVRSPALLATACDRLLRAGLIVRPIAIEAEGWLRITIGKPAQNDRLLAHLAAAIA